MPEFETVEQGEKLFRLVASRFPTVGLFDELVDSEEELRILFNLEMLTNPRMIPAMGRLELLPEGSIVTGNGAHQIMSAFVHCHDDGGRFNRGQLGAWYASLGIETAVAETVYHLHKRLSLSESGFPQQIQMRALVTRVNEPLLNLCGAQTSAAALYTLDDYTASQTFGENRRWPFNGDEAISGLQFDSVRHEGGINVCVYKPRALNQPIVQGHHYQYEWNAKGEVFIGKVTEMRI